MRAFKEGKLEECLAEIQYLKLLMDYAKIKLNELMLSTSSEYYIWLDKYTKLKKEYDGIMSVSIIHWLNE